MRRTLAWLLDSPTAPLVGSGLALGLGLSFVFIWAPHPWGWQGIDFYHDLALALVRGEPFGTTDVPWGYAYFVALCYLAFGEQPWIPLVVQVVANASIPVMLYHLVRPLADRRTAAVAALLVGVFSFNTVYASTQASDAICTVLFLAALLAFARGVRRGSAPWFLAAGLLAGLAPQFRPNLILFPVVLCLVYVALPPRSWRRAGHAALLLVTFALALAPWIVRNHRLTGEFLPTSTHGAIQLWYGTLQVGPYLENFSRNPRAVFASPTFPYTSLAETPIILTVPRFACDWDPETVRFQYWTDRDPQPVHLDPEDEDGAFAYAIPGQPLRTAVYFRFEADWSMPGWPPREPAFEGGRFASVYFVSNDHVGNLDRHGDLLDIFDIVGLIRYLAWREPLAAAERGDLDGDGHVDSSDLAEAVWLLLRSGLPPGAERPFAALDVESDHAVLQLSDGSSLTVPIGFSGRVTDLDVRGELAGALVSSYRSFAQLTADRSPSRPVPCRVMEEVRINQVFYRRELDRMRRYTALAMDNIAREPVAFGVATAYRMVRMFVIRGAGDQATVQQFSTAHVAYAVGFALSSAYLLTFVAGVAVAWRRRSALLWLLIPIVYIPATLGVVLTNMRYTVTVQPLMFAFVALAVVAVLRLDATEGGVACLSRSDAR